jgi:Family of unknown function (DUF6159)
LGGRISRGWRLTKDSLSVVRADSALSVLALLGLLVAAVLGLIPFAGGAWAFGEDQEVLGWILFGLAVFLAYLATVFFGVAIALAAAKVLAGEDATVGSAFAGASRRIAPIAGWAVVGAAVNVAFAILRDKGGVAGSVLAGVGGAAWSLVTFLAVPVIAFEGLGPIATLKRSAGLFRQRWGEQITGSVSISLVFFLLSLPAIALIVLGIVVGGAVGVIVAVLGALPLIVIVAVGRAASATFGAVLYRYAATGEAVGPFTAAELAAVARAKA